MGRAERLMAHGHEDGAPRFESGDAWPSLEKVPSHEPGTKLATAQSEWVAAVNRPHGGRGTRVKANESSLAWARPWIANGRSDCNDTM